MIYICVIQSRKVALVIAGLASSLLCSTASAKDASIAEIVGQLQRGGYVIVMRHARSPNLQPSASAADPQNPQRQRQLDQIGRQSAKQMGMALKALRIPIGEVWSSPTYRALQTIKLAEFPHPRIVTAIGADAAAEGAIWLQNQASRPPRPGTDTLIVTHYPNITVAFGKAAGAAADGEAIVFRPGAPLSIVGRIKIEQWPRFVRCLHSRL